MRKLLLFLGLASAEAKQPDFTTEWFMDRLALIESNDKADAIGDGGKARGVYQMHKDAWDDSIAYGRRIGRELIPELSDWKKNAHDRTASRIVANFYLQILEKNMKDSKHCSNGVTPLQLYMAWNMGLSGARRYDFNPNNPHLPEQNRRVLIRAKLYLTQ